MDKHFAVHIVELLIIVSLVFVNAYALGFFLQKISAPSYELAEPPPQRYSWLNTTDDRINDLQSIGIKTFVMATSSNVLLYNASNILVVHTYADFRRFAYNTKIAFVGGDFLFTILDGVIIGLMSPPPHY